MGLWGVGRAFSDRSFLKILIFSTDFGRFRGGEVNLPPPPRNRVKDKEEVKKLARSIGNGAGQEDSREGNF